MATSVESLYGNLWGQANPTFDSELKQSLSPRGPDCLYDLFASLAMGPEHTVADLGCRSAEYSVELAKRFGCKVIAVDPVPLHMETAATTINSSGMKDQITVRPGRIESLPLEDESIDAIWCRDVLCHVRLPEGFAECYGVLRPGAHFFIYVTLATDLLEPREAERLFRALALVPESMSRRFFEETAEQSGFELVTRDTIGSEWRERSLEGGGSDIVESLLRISRMRRREETLVRDHGRDFYEAALAGDTWGAYQILGKLCPTIYLMRKPGPRPGARAYLPSQI
jgi:SAM-dependent methyltransferase